VAFVYEFTLKIDCLLLSRVFDFLLLDLLKIVLVLVSWLLRFHDLLNTWVYLEFIFGSEFSDKQVQFLQVSLSLFHIFSTVICVLFMIFYAFY